MTEPAAPHVEARGPNELSDPLIRTEIKRAGVWICLLLLVAAAIYLAQPLLLIFAGIVFAAILDGGTRLLGRVLPIGRGWRLAIVAVAGFAFIIWTFVFAGMTLAAQFGELQEIVTRQADRALNWIRAMGVDLGGGGIQQYGQQLLGSLGRVTSAVTSAMGVIASLFMVLVLGIFIAVEPRNYERGVAWMMPMRARDGYYRLASRMGYVLRRLMFGRLVGMVAQGIATWLMLLAGGVPMATLLGLLTGVLAFIPNIGAIVSGILMVLAGFSAGVNTGLWAIAVYLIVQTADGYLITPYIAKRTVDLAPALVLGAQLIFGALFGLMGLALADPMLAMIKTWLEHRSDEDAARKGSATAEP